MGEIMQIEGNVEIGKMEGIVRGEGKEKGKKEGKWKRKKGKDERREEGSGE